MCHLVIPKHPFSRIHLYCSADSAHAWNLYLQLPSILLGTQRCTYYIQSLTLSAVVCYRKRTIVEIIMLNTQNICLNNYVRARVHRSSSWETEKIKGKFAIIATQWYAPHSPIWEIVRIFVWRLCYRWLLAV